MVLKNPNSKSRKSKIFTLNRQCQVNFKISNIFQMNVKNFIAFYSYFLLHSFITFSNFILFTFIQMIIINHYIIFIVILYFSELHMLILNLLDNLITVISSMICERHIFLRVRVDYRFSCIIISYSLQIHLKQKKLTGIFFSNLNRITSKF